MNNLLKTSFFFLMFSCAVNAQWTNQNSGTDAELWCIKAVNNNVLWASGRQGTVLSTSNGGVSWNLKTPTQIGYTNFEIDALGIDTAWILGNTVMDSVIIDSKIWKTVDGGNSWIEQYFSPNNCGDNIHFFDSNNGVYLGDPQPALSSKWELVTTTNGGSTWNRVPSSNYPPSDSINTEVAIVGNFECRGDTIWFPTYYNSGTAKNTRLFVSVNRGYNWTAFDLPTIGSDWNCISFSSSMNGIAVGHYSGIVSQTTDGGSTWNNIDTTIIHAWSVKNIPNHPNYFLWVGEDGNCVYSSNSGISWSPLSTEISYNLFDVAATTENVWAVGSNGSILRSTVDYVTSTGRYYNIDIPKYYMLNQNFPNPFNPATTISFSLPSKSFVSLRIFDLIGREVAIIVSEELSAGDHSCEWNAKYLPSGVYFYRLQSGNYIETKKLVLLK